MSYLVQQKVAGVDRAPLIETSAEGLRMKITRELEYLVKNNKQLQNYLKEIGTSRDSKDMRQQTQKLLSSNRDLISRCSDSISDFEKQVSDNNIGERVKKQQELTKFRKNLEEINRNFNKFSGDIKEKQSVYMEEAKRSFGALSIDRDDYTPTTTGAHYLFKSGFDREPSRSYSNVMKMSEDTNHMEDLIEERKKEVDRIEEIMIGIHDISTDIAEEVVSQKKKLDDMLQSTFVTKKAVNLGLREVCKADDYQRRSYGKYKIMMIMLVVIIVLALVAIFVIRPTFY